MEIIVPAAGLSTRFLGDKPKFMLYDYTGKSMLYRALEPFLDKHNIYIGILNEHELKFDISDFIKHEFGSSVNLVILKNRTKGPADTVSETLKLTNIPVQNSIFIKDCDSFFTHEPIAGNYVCVSKLQDKNQVFQPAGKSYVITDENLLIQKIVEKEIVSDTYCVGGYKFASISSFILGFESAKNVTSGEIYISHVIRHLSSNNFPSTSGLQMS
jgi:bifunctional N-acetylglucosamine-1-phosphate-uridyltransferase/glucosamine-1-phosphate-acetyltransferase GlmU-like protein